MAAQIPVKAIYSGSDVTSLGEFTASDDITITYLPTGTSSSTVALGDHTHATYLPLAGGTLTGNLVTNSLIDGIDIATRDGILTSTTTTAGAALPKAGGAMTGAITTNSTFDGVDVDACNTLANAAMPKSGGAFTGAITTNSTIDTIDIATRDGVLTSTTATAAAALPKAGGTMTGTLTVNAAAVFNESSADVDFRIESNNNANMLFVDGGNDRVGIGTGSPTFFLTAIGDATSDQATINQTHASYAGSALKIGAVRAANSAYNLLYCATGTAAGGTGGTAQFVVRGDGNVGIGTTSPSATLEVDGNVIAKTDTDTSNSGTVDLNFATNQNFVLTLDGNITSLTASNEVVGQSGFIAFIQDGTGSRTVALHGDYETPAAAGLTLTATASATDLVPYLVVASSRILLGAPQLAFA